MKDKPMIKTIKGIAAPLPLANVDTDVIMPKRFLITISREGLADGTFADLRFDAAGQKRQEFILNKIQINVVSEYVFRHDKKNALKAHFLHE